MSYSGVYKLNNLSLAIRGYCKQFVSERVVMRSVNHLWRTGGWFVREAEWFATRPDMSFNHNFFFGEDGVTPATPHGRGSIPNSFGNYGPVSQGTPVPEAPKSQKQPVSAIGNHRKAFLASPHRAMAPLLLQPAGAAGQGIPLSPVLAISEQKGDGGAEESKAAEGKQSLPDSPVMADAVADSEVIADVDLGAGSVLTIDSKRA